MGSKQEYDNGKRMRDLRDEAEESGLRLALAAQGLLERFVAAVEKIANRP